MKIFRTFLQTLNGYKRLEAPLYMELLLPLFAYQRGGQALGDQGFESRVAVNTRQWQLMRR